MADTSRRMFWLLFLLAFVVSDVVARGNHSALTPQAPHARTIRAGLILQKGLSPFFAFAADPNALVVNDTIYVFCSTDPASASKRTRYNNMREYTLLTAQPAVGGMLSWSSHGTILRPETRFYRELVFQRKLMFAPGAIFFRGYFYMYFPYLTSAEGSSNVGIARAINPRLVGSWELVSARIPQVNLFDPSIIISHDGIPYIYGNSREPGVPVFNSRMIMARLTSDLTNVVSPPVVFNQNQITEAVFVFWRRFIDPNKATRVMYYFLARVKSGRNRDAYFYWMADRPSPLFNKKQPGIRLTPNQFDAPAHISIAELRGQHYLFYHSGVENWGNRWKRSACYEPLYFNSLDGSILPVSFTCRYRRFDPPKGR